MFNKYYQEELAYLREMGGEFSKAHPDAAHFLGESGADPDVERLLEGFAFLTARLRQKLDDDFPEILHDLVEIFWPHYLRPIPSMAVVQFEALTSAAKEQRVVPPGAEVQSVPVDGTPCRFRTIYDVPLVPWSIESVTLRGGAAPRLALRMRMNEGASSRKLASPLLRLHLTGDLAASRGLYMMLRRYLKGVSIQPAGAAQAVAQPRASVRPLGFAPGDALLPWPAASFPGFRLLHEYFAFPAKFMFVEVAGLEGLAALPEAPAFDLLFDFTRMPSDMPPVSAANLLLHCSPAVNLFAHDADPIRLDHERTEYKVIPSGENPTHYEVYSLDKATGLLKGSGKPQEYRPLHRFAARGAGDESRYYRHRIDRGLVADRLEMFLTPLPPDAPGAAPEVETLSMELTCSNGPLPSKLKIGDLKTPGPTAPAFAKFRNVTAPTRAVPPPLGSGLYWKLLSHLSINYLSLIDLETLRGTLALYHFRARQDRQAETTLRMMLEGIKRIAAAPTTRLLDGSPVRGLKVELDVDEEGFGGEGEAYLFGALLDEFLSQYVTVNAFCRLTVRALKAGEIHSWPMRTGTRAAL
ncbi:MAG TPA: type VI secretion system baseplate subunit TssF [Planctomycetota bacterium]